MVYHKMTMKFCNLYQDAFNSISILSVFAIKSVCQKYGKLNKTEFEIMFKE